MKAMKKVVLILMAVCILGGLSVPGANATIFMSAARVMGAGGTGGQVWINLTDATAGINGVWFVADPASANQMLAAALTAQSNGATCWAAVSSSLNFSTLYNLFVQGQ